MCTLPASSRAQNLIPTRDFAKHTLELSSPSLPQRPTTEASSFPGLHHFGKDIRPISVHKMSFVCCFFFTFSFVFVLQLGHIKERSCWRRPWWLRLLSDDWLHLMMLFSGIAYHFRPVLSVLETKGNLERGNDLHICKSCRR